MAHQELLLTRDIVKKALVVMTNNHQAAGKKFEFLFEFRKGNKEIIDTTINKKTKSYYKLEVFMLDKTKETVDYARDENGEFVYTENGTIIKERKGAIRINLFRYCSPIDIKIKKDKAEEIALKAFISYCINTGLIVQLQMHQHNIEQKEHNNIEASPFSEKII